MASERQFPTPPGTRGRDLNELLNGVVGADSETKHQVLAAHADVQDATAGLRDAVARLHHAEDEAWRRYGEDVDRAIAEMDAELGVATTRLRIDQADSQAQLSAVLQETADAWRRRAEQARLQIRLGEMEARDAGLHAVEALDRAGHEMTSMISELRQGTAASMAVLRERTGGLVTDVRAALREVASALRSDSDVAGNTPEGRIRS